jgi:hypothetical protein
LIHQLRRGRGTTTDFNMEVILLSLALPAAIMRDSPSRDAFGSFRGREK